MSSHRNFPCYPIFFTLLSIMFAATAVAQITVTTPVPARATIQIHADQPASYRIPRTIFGSFLEPIKNSTYNGLWAEILVNPSLEENLWSASRIADMVHDEPALARASELGLPLPWEPLDARQGNRYEPHWGDAANSWRSLEVIGVPDQPTGIKQKVYLPVHRTLRYTGSLYAKHLSGPTLLTVSLRPRNSTSILASAKIHAAAGTWSKYSFTLALPADGLGRLAPADFVVQVDGKERVDLDQLSLLPADAIDGLDPDVVAMAKAMKTPLVRFGGNFTSGYHWRDGIGPEDKRVSMLNISWGIPEYNTFGTDEFLRFCQLIGAKPQIALNLGSGTPQEAADWVRYVDDRFNGGKGGLTWELGNELWGKWSIGWTTLAQLPSRTLIFSEAVRKVDPSARLIAIGADADRYRPWNAAQLANPAGTFDYLSTHFVVTTNRVQLPDSSDFVPANDSVQLPYPTPDFLAAASFALPVALGRSIRAMQAQIDRHPAFANQAHIALTEWLFLSSNNTSPSAANMGGAIETAGIFNMLMRNADIVPISDMTGIMEFAGIVKKRSQVYAAPSYYAFRMYSTADASRTVQVETQAGSYSVHKGITRHAEIPNVPYLDVVAALNDAGDTLTLFCVNRHLRKDVATEIDLQGFRASRTARAQTLQSGSIYEVNDATDPKHITPADSTLTVSSGHIVYTFPHESVTVLTFHKL
ncbi:MAG: alpha-L-arabinofuranosidase C-terminal domain-containing protein [Acidobacteriaceae bacterium]